MIIPQGLLLVLSLIVVVFNLVRYRRDRDLLALVRAAPWVYASVITLIMYMYPVSLLDRTTLFRLLILGLLLADLAVNVVILRYGARR